VTRIAKTADGEELAYRIHGAPGKTPMDMREEIPRT